MKLLRKMQTAARIISNDGFGAFSAVLRERIVKPEEEYDECNVVFEVLKANKNKGLMIDVGAHFGGSLAKFARCGWEIHAFEPDSQNREKLVTSFGDVANVRIDKRAVSDHEQSGVEFFRSDVSTGISGLSVFHSSHKPAEKVDVTTIEKVIQEKNLTQRQIDFLKIDTEGFDIFVLKGVPWDKVKPRAIVCEFEDSKTVPLGYTYHDLARYLTDRGYKVVVSEWEPIKEYGTKVPWKRCALYPCELTNAKAWGNLIAVSDESLLKRLVKVCSI